MTTFAETASALFSIFELRIALWLTMMYNVGNLFALAQFCGMKPAIINWKPGATRVIAALMAAGGNSAEHGKGRSSRGHFRQDAQVNSAADQVPRRGAKRPSTAVNFMKQCNCFCWLPSSAIQQHLFQSVNQRYSSSIFIRAKFLPPPNQLMITYEEWRPLRLHYSLLLLQILLISGKWHTKTVFSHKKSFSSVL